MTHDSFAASKSVISAFESANNVKVQFIASGDAGTALNKAILAKDNPFADVFYGVDNTFLSRALTEDIFQPYNSPMLADIPAQYKLDPQNQSSTGGLGRCVLELRYALLFQAQSSTTSKP